MDIERSVKQLLTMGFHNEDLIRNTLKETSYDVNAAISLLMSYDVAYQSDLKLDSQPSEVPVVADGVPKPHQSYTGSYPLNSGISANIVGHDLSNPFDPNNFNQLQSRVYVDQWDIPCLRSQLLGKCILGATHELCEHGVGALEANPLCRQFVLVCLTDCVTKLTTSQAVFNWDRGLQEGVHNMLELTIRLICTYLKAFEHSVRSADEREDPDCEADAHEKKAAPEHMRHFAWELFQQLALIFDCESNYHQSCRDRNTNYTVYSDPFNDWTSMAKSETVDQGSSGYAEPLPSPRNFYLVNLINCFGLFGGFQSLLWLGIQPWVPNRLLTAILFPLANCADYLTAHCLEHENVIVLMQRVLWRLSNLNENDFKDRDSRVFDMVMSVRVLTYRLNDLGLSIKLLPFLTTMDISTDCQSPLEPCWSSFTLPPVSDPNQYPMGYVLNQIDRLHCMLLLSSISPPQGSVGASFTGRMLALRNLVEQLEAGRVELDNDGMNSLLTSPSLDHRIKRRRPVRSQLSSATILASENAAFLMRRIRRRAIRLEYFMSWLRESEVILKCMHNLDNTSYMTVLGQMFHLLGDRLTKEDLTTVWHRTTNQPGATVDNILTLLIDVASNRFVDVQMNHLFYLVETSWLNLNSQAEHRLSTGSGGAPVTHAIINKSEELSHIRHGRARLLNLIGRIGITTTEPWKVDQCTELLWNLAQATYRHADNYFDSLDPKQERMSTSGRNYIHPEPVEAALAQQIVILREFRCSGHEQRSRAVGWLTSAVDQIRSDSLTYFILAYVKSLLELILKNFVGRAKRDHLNELIRTHDLINEVVASLLRYEQWAMRSHGDLLCADSLDHFGFRHSDVIKRHFELLHYLLRIAELTLTTDRTKALWETLIGNPRVSSSDREQCFTWLTASLNHLEADTQTVLFVKLILKSNPAFYRSLSSFECFKSLFEKVNLHDGRLKQVSKSWHVEKPDLIGLDFLWDLYLTLPSSDASLDGVHMNNPGGQPGVNGDKSIDPGGSATVAKRDPSGSSTMGINPSSMTGKNPPNAVRLARQLLLDVHWGQLAPRLRRDPEACYRRFFDSCRHRLESNWSAERGLLPKRGVQSALAETGQLLAALLVGPGAASRAKHSSLTAARLSLRRLLGLVYAYIQTVEDEIFGSRVFHANWRPHGMTFRGWEMNLPVRVETLKPGQTNPTVVGSTNAGGNISPTYSRNIFAPLDTTSAQKSNNSTNPSVSLLVHSNEMLGSVRERANLFSTAVVYANRTGGTNATTTESRQSSLEPPNWTTSALYIGPSCVLQEPVTASVETPRRSSAVEDFSRRDKTPTDGGDRNVSKPCSKQILDTLANRKAVGELGFQLDRILTVRLIASLNGRTSAKSGRLGTSTPGGSSNLSLVLSTSKFPSVMSLATSNQSEIDLASHTTATDQQTQLRRPARPLSSLLDSHSFILNFRKSPNPQQHQLQQDTVSTLSASNSTNQLPRGISLLSLNSNPGAVGSIVDLSTTQQQQSQYSVPTTTNLPSLCMGADPSVYELLLDLADAEINQHPGISSTNQSYSGLSSASASISHRSVTAFGLSTSFSLIHPIRLLLATLPTFRPNLSNSRSSNQLQQSLFCSPASLLKSSPYRTLYKLQILSASLIPIDVSPWWDISPGCLLSPPSKLYLSSTILSSSSTAPILPTSIQQARSTPLVRDQQSPSSRDYHLQIPNHLSPTGSDLKWFLSGELYSGADGDPSTRSNNISAPSSPLANRRRHSFTSDSGPTMFEGVGKHKKLSSTRKTTVPSLIAQISPIEFLDPLVRLLQHHLPDHHQTLTVLQPIGLIKPSKPSTSFLPQLQTSLAANRAWYYREVQHLSLQLIAFLLNPKNVDRVHTPCLGAHAASSGQEYPQANNAPSTFITPHQISDLLSALLETAIQGAAVAETIAQAPSPADGDFVVGSNQLGLRRQLLQATSSYQPSKDTRAGIAGVIEMVSTSGMQLLFQDVEISVQSIRLMFQCVIANPKDFLEPFLALDQLDEKLLRLLVYSPSARIRTETARQLEQMSLLTTQFLRYRERCIPHPDECVDECLIHTRLFYPKLLRFLLRVVFLARLPFYSTANLKLQPCYVHPLLANSMDYFHLRAFLVGQTPVGLLQSWFEREHVNMLKDEFANFRNLVTFPSNFSPKQFQLTDILMAGHLEAARVLCAQLVALVISHAECSYSNLSIASADHNHLSPTTNCDASMYKSTYSPLPLGADQYLRRVCLPTVLLQAIPNDGRKSMEEQKNVITVNLSEFDPLLRPPGQNVLDDSVPIDGQDTLELCICSLRVAREFITYIITDCLFPAASHILQTRPPKDLSTLARSLEVSLTSLVKSSPHDPVEPLQNESAQIVRLNRSMGALTRRAAFAFLTFLSRIDVHSFERVVDLLIVLHHNQDNIRSFTRTPYNTASSAIHTPDNRSGRATPLFGSVSAGLNIHTINNLDNMCQRGIDWDIQPTLVGRAESGFVGLRNGGATCYMNAVLQQLFMQPGLAEALLSVTDKGTEYEEGNILYETQRLFGHLLESQLEYYDPVGFWKSFHLWDTSAPVNPHEQQDAFDFFQALIDQLDEELKKLKRKPFFQAIYQGIFLDSKFCDQCDHRYDREEVFSAINLTVKAHDLQDALNQFVRGEVLDGDNAYYCERCRVKRRAVKRLSIHTLPPVLCLHLKRFDFDWDRQIPVKFSDHFKFPQQLDMGPYMTDSNQRLRPEAFFSPNSSTSSLLQREAHRAPLKHQSSVSEENDKRTQLSTGTQSQELCTTMRNTVNCTQSPIPKINILSQPAMSTKLDASCHPGLLENCDLPTLQQNNQDLYRLVGIVVHSGQANSGHYYAFIKDRGCGDARSPSPSTVRSPRIDKKDWNESELSAVGHSSDLIGLATESKKNQARLRNLTESRVEDPSANWYRFNDNLVEPVQLTDSLLEHECFGGTYKVPSADGKTMERRTRYWSAYLLFYERIDLNHDALRQNLTNVDPTVMAKSFIKHSQSVGISGRDNNLYQTTDGEDTASSNHPPLKFTLSGSLDNVHIVSSDTSSHISTTTSTHIHTEPQHESVQMKRPTCLMEQIWKENWTFLRDRYIYSRDYFEFIRGLCEGILEDVSSIQREPQRGVLGTRLLAHFFFTSFVCLHPRVKAQISGHLVQGQVLSTQALKDISIQQNSEWLGLLARLACTSAKACRWLMHFLSTSPTHPCLFYLLLVPKPFTRQQLANTILTVLRAFYSFKETNILDGALTGFMNHLLGLLDCGIVAEHATEAGTLFAMLRGYVEMCPHASLHLMNLKTSKRLLAYLMEPRDQSNPSADELQTGGKKTELIGSSFSSNAPNWSDKLRPWTPAQQREMGNLYYLLCLFILQANLDDFRTVKIRASIVKSLLDTNNNAVGQFRQNRIMTRPQKETIEWLGLMPSTLSNPQSISGIQLATHRHQSTNYVVPGNDTYLVGLYRLCEVLVRAYLENPTTPNLASSLGLTEVAGPLNAAQPDHFPMGGKSGVGASSALGAAVKTTSSQAAATAGDESIPLRQLIRQTILHMISGSWEASYCLILTLQTRIANRPQSELRHFFDLLAEILQLCDPLQTARIAAVVDGLVLQPPAAPQELPRWCLRPNANPKLWAWSSDECEQNMKVSDVNDTIICEAQSAEYGWPSTEKGLLELIISASQNDSRRAYQCVKFIVQLSSENPAFLSYLCRFPERWEPVVRWLENLMDYYPFSSGEVTDRAYTHHSSVGTVPFGGGLHQSSYRVDQADSEGLFMVFPSATSLTNPGQRPPELRETSNESDETNNSGFQRTVSAQTTLREATRLLFTMPRIRYPPNDATSHLNAQQTGLSAPLSSTSTARKLSEEQVEGEKQTLFFQLD